MSSRDKIRASIIVPTQNRANILGHCLSSLAHQTVLPDSYEILVIDNASTDSTEVATRSFIDHHPENNIRYFFEPVPGLLSGRHRGTQEAGSPLLVFVDDDSVASPEWLEAILGAFSDPTVHLVGGPSRGLFRAPPPQWMDAFSTNDRWGTEMGCLSLQDMGPAIIEVPPQRVWGLNYSIRRSTLFALGGFHPDCVPAALQRFQGDGETGLSHKIQEAGYRTLYHPRAVVGHIITADRLTPEYIERRYYYQGVCDSYTNIRARGTTAGLLPPDPPREPSGSDFQTPEEFEKARMRYRAKIAYVRGVAFHLGEVSQDATLLEWVLRQDYLSDWTYPLTSGDHA